MRVIGHAPMVPARGLLPARALVLLAAVAPNNATAVAPVPLPTDEYFAEYATLYDHIGMLQDFERMGAYHDAIRLNAERHFKGKVVLDVGAGTGVLSIWAAQAGASRVYSVEATNIADHAEKLAEAHGFSDVVTVLRGRMENIELPEQVDVVISEWMGYFLLRESMVQSVLYARDRWLKPTTGVMYPSHCTIHVAALHEPGFAEARETELGDAMKQWDELATTLSSKYSLHFDALRSAYQEEHIDYAYRQAWQGLVADEAVLGTPTTVLSVDMHTTSMGELFGWRRRVQLDQPLEGEAEVRTVCGWFTARFCAGEAETAGGSGGTGGGGDDGGRNTCVELDTSPLVSPTHWAHTTFALEPSLTAPYELDVSVEQSHKSRHDINVTFTYASGKGAMVDASYAITADFRGDSR